MIPGITAGYPGAPTASGTVTVAEVTSTDRRFIAYSWVSSPGAMGSVNPAAMNVNPSVSPVAGAVGEILALQGSNLSVYVRGSGSTSTTPGSFASLAAVPFTSMTINGVVFNKSAATLRSGYILDWAIANPLNSGALTQAISFS